MKVRLIFALRYFAGGDPWDLFGRHGVLLVSVYTSVWGAIDVVNRTELLALAFPDVTEQEEIASGFFAKSGAGFSFGRGCRHWPCVSISPAAN